MGVRPEGPLRCLPHPIPNSRETELGGGRTKAQMYTSPGLFSTGRLLFTRESPAQRALLWLPGPTPHLSEGGLEVGSAQGCQDAMDGRGAGPPLQPGSKDTVQAQPDAPSLVLRDQPARQRQGEGSPRAWSAWHGGAREPDTGDRAGGSPLTPSLRQRRSWFIPILQTETEAQRDHGLSTQLSSKGAGDVLGR